ncbi:hypothetical protein OK074_3771 [Actinobacteria bacterium OK074]|nr:hypothetical protein OK074_3771 [Actinobacteria bacterium OK074]
MVGVSAQARRERYFQAISLHPPAPPEPSAPEPGSRPGESADGPVRPGPTEVTRRLCAAAHARPNRLEPVRSAWRHLRAHGFGFNSLRALLSGDQRHRQQQELTCPPLGEPLARWAIGKVLLSRLRVVPSYGFDLGPVLAHCLAARRQWRIRRTAQALALGWITYRFPLGVGVWAVAAVLALVVAWPPRRPTWRQRRGSWAGRAWVAALLFVLLPGLVMLLRPDSRPGRETFWAAGCTMLSFLAARVVDRLVALGYALACERRSRSPWTGPRIRRRITAIERAQLGRSLPYELYETHWRFIGAGKSPWGRSTISIKLQGEKDDEDGSVRKDFKAFDIEELLEAVREELEDLRLSEPPFHPLRCEVEEIRGGPDRRWARLPRNPGGGQSSTNGGWERPQDPKASGHEVRSYLSAQVSTWSGQLVVTVLASAVIEGQELHFVVRPHVLSPLFEEVEEAVDPEQLRRVTAFVQIPVQALGDLLALGLGCWRFLRWWTRERSRETVPDEELTQIPGRPLPTSLRERYSPVYTSDMHVSEDAVRHVAIVESSMFTTVEEFLEDKGVDVTDFKRQVQKVMNIIHAGDNNIIQAVAVGHDAKDVRQQSEASEDLEPSRPDKREASDTTATQGKGDTE